MEDKSQIIDEQTHTQIDIHSTETNMNSQFYTEHEVSLSDAQSLNHGYEEDGRQKIQLEAQNEPYALYCNQKSMKKRQLDLQQFAICLESIEYSLTRIFYRAFQNKLISFYIQSLKQQQRKQRETRQLQIKLLKEENWPFKQLFYKKYRNQNQQIMFEFVSMCAEKIQATFKGYMAWKRHTQAIKRINNFRGKLAAVAVGWKTWNIYNCRKVKEMRNAVMGIERQIDAEIENPNLDRMKKMKKIQYLNSSLGVVKENFHYAFGQLFVFGAWIYEVDQCFKKPMKKGKANRGEKPYQMNVQTSNLGISSDETKNVIEPKPKARKRQFQGGLSRNSKPQLTQSKPSTSYQDQPIKAKGSYEQNLSTAFTSNQTSGLQQRPIVAKGTYHLTEQDLKNSQNEFLKGHQNQRPIEGNEEQQSPRVNKFKDDEKKKLNKRQKYDPRKAIEEEKLRLEEERKKKLEKQKQAPSQISVQLQNTGMKKKPQKKANQATKKTPRIIKKQPQRGQVESPRESSKDKTVQKIKKESHLTKKGDNSKSIKLIVNNKKVESKVNCWGPKKDTSQTQIQASEQSSYKSKYLISLKERTESKMTDGSSYKQVEQSRKAVKEHKSISINEEETIEIQEQPPKMSNKLDRRQSGSDGEEAFQSSYLKRLVQEKQKGGFTYGVKGYVQRKFVEKTSQATEERYSQKIAELQNNMKRLSQNSSTTNLKPPQERKSSTAQATEHQQKKKQQVHRSIEFLEQVYSGQYTDRFNTLKNKLNMLQSTRYIQRDDSIPILLEDSKFIRKIYKDHAFSSLYWPQVRTMETNFLDYIKFSGF